MAIGTTAAVLGASAIGAGASLMGSRSQASAARQAGQVAQDTSREQIALYRDIFNQQRSDYEPFRQFELQRANALGEIFGFDPVGQPANSNAAVPQGNSYVPNIGNYAVSPNGDLQRAVGGNSFNMGGFGDIGGAEPGLRRANAFQQRGQALTPEQLAQITGGQAAPGGKQINAPIQDTAVSPAGGMQVLGAGNMQAESGQVGNVPTNALGPTVDPSVAGADRFNNSLFNAAFTNNFARDRDNIDQNLASQGLAFSGARMNAVENSRANNFQNALGNYLNSLMGAPSSGAATAGTANAGANFAANAGQSIGNRGVGMMNSALNVGNAQANAVGGVGNALGFALGGLSKPNAFSLG
jgi:hypothetical protein